MISFYLASHLIFQGNIQARIHDENMIGLCEIDPDSTSSHGQKEHCRGRIVLVWIHKILEEKERERKGEKEG